MNSKQLYKQVKILMTGEKWNDSIELLESNISNIDFTWKHYWSLAWSYFKLNSYNKAVQEFENALSNVPKNKKSKAICLCFLGIAVEKTGDSERSKKLLEQSLNLRDNGLTRLSLAIKYMELGDLRQAELIHKEGLELKPNHPYRLNNYAAFLEDVGRQEEANVIYKKIKNTMPNNSSNEKH